MNFNINLVALTILMSSSVSHGDDASGQGFIPPLNPRGEVLLAIEADRDAVIIDLASRVPERDRSDYLLELDQLENHELINLMVNNSLESMSFGNEDDYSKMVYNALSAPCRILDTRKYDPSDSTSQPIGAGVAREVFDYSIGGQGGDATCGNAIPDDNQALVVALSAISPTFPDKFPSLGFATLLNGSEITSAWTQIGNVPGVTDTYYQYTYNTPPFNKAATIVWDSDTRLITTLAAVSRRTPTPDIVLYSSGQAHYTIDVVGYFDNPRVCPAGTTFIDGLCWGPQQAAATWFNASQDCAQEGGRLPPAAAINGACRTGDLPNVAIWASGFYVSGTYRGQVTNSSIDEVTTTTPTPYRCIFTPLTAP